MCAETTFRTECAAEAIEYAVKNYPDMEIGEGTVINAEQCEKALAAPFPQVRFIPTGGVDRGNIDEFLAFDKVAAIGGSFFVKEALEKIEQKK